jgi:phosphoadenosine phosphosulfate reductase
MPEEMFLVRKHYPDDYKKIQQWFPYVDASLKQYEYFHGKNQQDKVPVR